MLKIVGGKDDQPVDAEPTMEDMEKMMLDRMAKAKPGDGPIDLGTITVQVNTAKAGKSQEQIMRELSNRQKL